MFVLQNTTYTISLVVTDISDVRVVDDNPYVLIRNNNNYWNGISWQTDEFRIYLLHISNGVYTHEYICDTLGEIQFTCVSESYNERTDTSIQVYSEDSRTTDWEVDVLHRISYSSAEDVIPTVIIYRSSDGAYLNAENEFVPEETALPMSYTDGVWLKYFTPTTIGEYIIRIQTVLQESMYILNTVEYSDNIPEIIVNNATLRSLDGSDTLLINEKGLPLHGVSIKAFDFKTKDISGTAESRSDGTWEMMLKPGKYQFQFSLPGFISSGFERVIS